MSTKTITSKLYCVVRADLEPGAQAAQLSHALIQFQREHQEIADTWYVESNTLVLLSVPNEGRLEQLCKKAQWKGIAVSCFHEPDLDMSMTAVAIAPEGAAMLRGLPLALCSSSPFS